MFAAWHAYDKNMHDNRYRCQLNLSEYTVTAVITMATVELCVSRIPGCHLTLLRSPTLSPSVRGSTCVSDLVSDSGHRCSVIRQRLIGLSQSLCRITCVSHVHVYLQPVFTDGDGTSVLAWLSQAQSSCVNCLPWLPIAAQLSLSQQHHVDTPQTVSPFTLAQLWPSQVTTTRSGEPRVITTPVL